MMGGAILGLVVLGCIRKQAEQAMGSKAVNISLYGTVSLPAWVLLLASLKDGLWCQVSSFIPYAYFVQ